VSGTWQREVTPTSLGLAIPPQTSPALVEGVLRDVAENILSAIVSQWPVDTGLSLAGFDIHTASPTSILVYNEVPYTEYVHEGLADQVFDQAIAAERTSAQSRLDALVQRSNTAPGTRPVSSIWSLANRPTTQVRDVVASSLPSALAAQGTIKQVELALLPLKLNGRLPRGIPSLIAKAMFVEVIRRLNAAGERDAAKQVEALVKSRSRL
jgi:hypothetical protein